MAFVGIYRALYDYAPQSDEELEIKDGDLLFILDKSSDDDWWKCKKKAANDDDDEEFGNFNVKKEEVTDINNGADTFFQEATAYAAAGEKQSTILSARSKTPSTLEIFSGGCDIETTRHLG